jgi:hypothetical protein
MSNQVKTRVIARHPPETYPYASIIINSLRGQDTDVWKSVKTVTEIELQFVPSGDVLKGDLLAAKYFSRLQSDLGLYGSDAFTATEVKWFVIFC